MQSSELRVQQWLATHHSVVTRGRAVALGMTDDMVDHRLRSGRWTSLHRGVYTDACSEVTPMRTMVAALAVMGPGTLASHLSAAWLMGIVKAAPPQPWVLAPSSRRRSPSGVRVSRSEVLPVAELRHKLPCTPVVRTLVDCAAVAPEAVVADLVDSALALRVVTLGVLSRALAAASPPSRRRGRRVLRTVLTERGMIGGPSPSVLESRAARIIGCLDLPPPTAELQWTDGRGGRNGGERYRLDFAWADLRLAVEVDGYAYHSSPERMAHDLRRRNAMVRAGWTVLVYSWRDVVDDAVRVGREITATYRSLRPDALGAPGRPA